MQHIRPGRPHPLHAAAATRSLEARVAEGLPPHTLMQRAGLATAQLALAIAPHAQRYWIACGPGNNGGDGLEAALHLQRWGKQALVTWLATPESAPADARAAHARAQAAGVQWLPQPPDSCDFAIDALLGIGASRAPQGRLADCIARLNALPVPVLAVDLPSGLNADTGTPHGACVHATHTLSLLTLKPGLYTAHGRDHAGQVWLDTLDVDPGLATPQAWLGGPPAASARRHASHKGSYGDVAVIGGAAGMGGAALLAASAALHHGAGRVYVALLGDPLTFDPARPELMLRAPGALDPAQLTVVAGCGGGAAIAPELPRLLSAAPRLVLDADALNALARDEALHHAVQARRARGHATILTPHPLEAARLLRQSTAEVQAQRLTAAQTLADNLQCTVLLKGSGSIIASPGETPHINPTGNPRLAIGGTGDVLAGILAARWQADLPAHAVASQAAWEHGALADQWPAQRALIASALAQAQLQSL